VKASSLVELLLVCQISCSHGGEYEDDSLQRCSLVEVSLRFRCPKRRSASELPKDTI
jgi:hypothetical protein